VLNKRMMEMPRLRAWAPVCLVILSWTATGFGQLSQSAYRVLGQSSLRQNGLNGVEGNELRLPRAAAVDRRDGVLHLYVADTGNHRVLGWRDANAAGTDSRADVVLGQSSFQHTAPLGIGPRGLNAPEALVVHPATGDVYVADTGNHRVLRFPNPFADPSRVDPDAVYGQPDFESRSANTGGVSNHSLRSPVALAFDKQRNLWVADAGNHRVLRFPAGSLDSPNATADTVIGQTNFQNASPNAGAGGISAGGFNQPAGLAFDKQGALFVADFSNARVLVFPAQQSTGQQATRVLGQESLTARVVLEKTTSSGFRGPLGLGADASGRLYVAVPLEHRVLVFDNASLAAPGTAATRVLGQAALEADAPNRGTNPRAGPSGLLGATSVTIDADGQVFVADTANNRIISYPPDTGTATKVWGQPNLSSNGPNRIDAGSIARAGGVAIDYASPSFPLYVSDSANHRVLVWKDSRRFESGAPADLVIGQPDFSTALANIDSSGQKPTQNALSTPRGIAVDAVGHLFVADSGNNRVLRFPRPLEQQGRISADLVLGQPDFFSANSANVSASRFNSPSDVAIGPAGSLFVADTGNNRVLAFPAGVSNGAAAVAVFGQPDFATGSPPNAVSAQTLSFPSGITVDGFGFLYVADSGANRVLIFPNAEQASGGDESASIVVGQPGFNSALAGAGANRLRNPQDVETDAAGEIYVSDGDNNRVLRFPSLLFLPLTNADAAQVVGQSSMTGTRANFNSSDSFATAEGLFSPSRIRVDRNSTLYVADTGNSRVAHFLRPVTATNAIHFQAGAPVAPGSLVTLWGQNFTDQTAHAAALPLPEALGGITVELRNQVQAPLLFVSSQQINLQLPGAASVGSQSIAVRRSATDELLAGGSLQVAEAGPGLFSTQSGGSGQALAINQDGTLNSAENPAPKGSTVTLFGSGQGDVNPPVPDGQAPPAISETVASPVADGASCLAQQQTVCVAIGSTFGEILFSGLAPGFVGLWQINVKIPDKDTVLTGPAVAVRAVIHRRASNVVSLAIR